MSMSASGSSSGGMEDFWRLGYGATASSAASNYLPTNSYYGQMHAQYHPSMASMASNSVRPGFTGLGSTGFGPAVSAGFSLSTAAPNPMLAGATA